MKPQYAADEQRWADWMAQALRGDRTVYGRLLAELGHAIEAYLRANFGNLDALEDCVQECLLAIHAARHTYDPTRPFRPWLFTVVRHKAIDVLRQRASWHNLVTTTDDVDAAQEVNFVGVIDGVRMLEQLSPDHREMVLLAKYGGYTTAEAAARLGISESAAKARLLRGLAAIEKLLAQEGRTT